MVHSLSIASEIGKTFFNATYDLAIAKIVLRIQSANEKFKNLFIIFETFHILMSLHKAIGKFIKGSGLTNILIAFLSSKHFNRCKNIHPLFSFTKFTNFASAKINCSLRTSIITNLMNFASNR